jgi:hypothetical protein
VGWGNRQNIEIRYRPSLKGGIRERTISISNAFLLFFWCCNLCYKTICMILSY